MPLRKSVCGERTRPAEGTPALYIINVLTYVTTYQCVTCLGIDKQSSCIKNTLLRSLVINSCGVLLCDGDSQPFLHDCHKRLQHTECC